MPITLYTESVGWLSVLSFSNSTSSEFVSSMSLQEVNVMEDEKTRIQEYRTVFIFLVIIILNFQFSIIIS